MSIQKYIHIKIPDGTTTTSSSLISTAAKNKEMVQWDKNDKTGV